MVMPSWWWLEENDEQTGNNAWSNVLTGERAPRREGAS
jgi:hypothetical protein